jgi:hypothetical protein
MVYSTYNYWVLEFFHRPVFLGVETRRFGNWICFRPQVKVRPLISITVILFTLLFIYLMTHSTADYLSSNTEVTC